MKNIYDEYHCQEKQYNSKVEYENQEKQNLCLFLHFRFVKENSPQNLYCKDL